MFRKVLVLAMDHLRLVLSLLGVHSDRVYFGWRSRLLRITIHHLDNRDNGICYGSGYGQCEDYVLHLYPHFSELAHQPALNCLFLCDFLSGESDFLCASLELCFLVVFKDSIPLLPDIFLHPFRICDWNHYVLDWFLLQKQEGVEEKRRGKETLETKTALISLNRQSHCQTFGIRLRCCSWTCTPNNIRAQEKQFEIKERQVRKRQN